MPPSAARRVCRAEIGALPSVGDALVVERRGVVDQVALDVLHPRFGDRSRQRRHRQVGVGVEARRHRRVAVGAEIEVALHGPVGFDRAVAQDVGGEAVLRPEPVERDGGGEQLHRGGGLHHLARVLGEERVAARQRGDHHTESPAPDASGDHVREVVA
jgi:hypothetical protein